MSPFSASDLPTQRQTAELFNLEGKVAVVTGGARGIGAMITRGLVTAGVRVYICSRHAEHGRAIAEALEDVGDCRPLSADLATAAGMDHLVSQVGAVESGVHILVNNAGATWGAPLDAFPEKGWDKVMDLNLKTPFFLSQALLPLLSAAGSEQDPARIINIGSIDGLRTPELPSFSYGASKAGVHQLTRHLASFLAQRRITVNAIAPGLFDTDMLAPVRESLGEEIFEQIPRGRFGIADDIVGAVTFLSSRAGAYITGAVLPVDGGLSTCR